MDKREEQTLEKIVARLLVAVKEQEKKYGYLFWYHPEKSNGKTNN